MSAPRASNLTLSFCHALLNCTVRLWQTPPSALGLGVMSSPRAHAHTSYGAKTGVSPPGCVVPSVRDTTRRVLGLGGLAHLNVSLTRGYTGVLFPTFIVIFIVHRNCSAPGAAAPDHPHCPPWTTTALAVNISPSTGNTPLCMCPASSLYDIWLLIAHEFVYYFLKSPSTLLRAYFRTYLRLRLHPGPASPCWLQRRIARFCNWLINTRTESTRHRQAPHRTVPRWRRRN